MSEETKDIQTIAESKSAESYLVEISDVTKILNLSNTDDYITASDIIKKLVKVRGRLDKKRLELSKYHRDKVKKINDYGNGLIKKLKLEEEKLKTLKDAEDRKIEIAEENRALEIKTQIENMFVDYREFITNLDNKTSVEITEKLSSLHDLEFSKCDFQEYIGNAILEKNELISSFENSLQIKSMQEKIAEQQSIIDKQRASTENETQSRSQCLDSSESSHVENKVAENRTVNNITLTVNVNEIKNGNAIREKGYVILCEEKYDEFLHRLEFLRNENVKLMSEIGIEAHP